MSAYYPSPSAIRAMFAAVAPVYDLNNRLFSLGLDQTWRRRAVRASALRAGESVLDVGCGTGDLAGLFRRAGAGRVTGVDFCPDMLALARRKFAGRGIEWLCADATRLPLEDGRFDVVSAAFALRNMADPDAALREACRVLRPGGRLVVLEFAWPRSGLLAKFLRFYVSRVLPLTAGAIARDAAGAYDYLQGSIRGFPPPERLAERIRRAGLADVTTWRLAFGLVALHLGRRE